MRDADEWAKSLHGAEYVDDDTGWQTHKIAALIREAQLDGVRHAEGIVEVEHNEADRQFNCMTCGTPMSYDGTCEDCSPEHEHVFNKCSPQTYACLVCGKTRKTRKIHSGVKP